MIALCVVTFYFTRIHYQGKQPLHFSFAPMVNRGHFLKVRISSFRSKFLSFREDPLVEELYLQEKQTGKQIKVFPFVVLMGKHGFVPAHLYG